MQEDVAIEKRHGKREKNKMKKKPKITDNTTRKKVNDRREYQPKKID